MVPVDRLRGVEIGLLAAMVGVYLAAKLHTLRSIRLGLPEYLAEHWPYWAAMIALGVLMRIVSAALADAGARRPTARHE